MADARTGAAAAQTKTAATDSATAQLLRGVPVSRDPLDRSMVAHDLWPRRLILRREESPPTSPSAVYWPRSDEEVAAVVRAARVERRPLVPFGAGSGVCGGVSPNQAAWVLDLKRLDRIWAVDPVRRTVTVEAGLLGVALEEHLNARGFTLGHFPSSIYCSTVGGWVATRSAGQLSSRFGKIEDMVLAVQGVDGRGDPIHAAVDDPRTGPAAVQLLVGSEGALAVLTRFVLRIQPIASHAFLRGFSFADLPTGLSAMRRLMQTGEAPSVLRLYDPLDSALAGAVAPGAADEPLRVVAGGIGRAGLEDSGPGPRRADGGSAGAGSGGSADGEREEPTLFDALVRRMEELAVFTRPGATRRVVGEILGRPMLANSILDRFEGRPRLVLGIEGDADTVARRASGLRAQLQALGAQDLGDAPGSKWLKHRHRVSYRMSRAFAVGAWVDTCEVAVGWPQVEPLYRAMREALRDVAVVMCHFSHAYLDGCSLYFTFAGGGTSGSGPRSGLARYDQCWERALLTIRRDGAVVAHHHGLGRSKLPGVRRDPGTVALLAALKRELDPDGVLNPGALGLGEAP